MKTFDQFDSRTTIQATLKMRTALSIGARSSLDPTGTDLPVIKGPDGLPFLPGSSIKGVIRSQMERVLRSIPETYRLWACDPLADPCLTPDYVSRVIPQEIQNELPDASQAKYETAYSQKIWDKSCTICRLFGSQSFCSRLFFKDAFLTGTENVPYITQIRDGVGIDRDLGSAKNGIKYDFEVVVPGVCFAIEILAENVEPWEIGLLLGVLRFWEEGSLSLGGKSTRGPGWGALEGMEIRRVEKDGLLGYLTEGKIERKQRDIFQQAFQAQLKNWEGGSRA